MPYPQYQPWGMPYQTQPYQPTMPTGYAQQTPVHGFVYVNGIEGAKAYQMPPNSEMPLFDSTSDGVMFIKQTDGAGYPTITVVDCKRRGDEATGTVTRGDLDKMYSDLAAQIEQLKEAINGTVSAATSTAEPDDVVPTGSKRRPTRRVQPADED